MENFVIPFSIKIAAVMIIIALSFIAIYYLAKLKQQTKRQRQALDQLEKSAEQKYQKIRRDIVFIAQAFLEDQVELPEASLRISRLADLIVRDEDQRKTFEVFDKISNRIKDIPTHENWKQLSRQERKKHELTLKKLSDEYSVSAKTSAEIIVKQSKSLH